MFVFVDTETGGLTPDYSLLTVAAVITDQDFNILEKFCFNLKSDVYIVHPEAIKINRIDLVEHASTSMSQDMATKEFKAFLARGQQITGKNRLIPAGHSVHFDLAFLWAHVIPEHEWKHYCKAPVLDTAVIAQLLSTTGHITCGCSLVALRNFYNITGGEAHNAENDILATIELAKIFTSLFKGLPKS